MQRREFVHSSYRDPSLFLLEGEIWHTQSPCRALLRATRRHCPRRCIRFGQSVRLFFLRRFSNNPMCTVHSLRCLPYLWEKLREASTDELLRRRHTGKEDRRQELAAGFHLDCCPKDTGAGDLFLWKHRGSLTAAYCLPGSRRAGGNGES